MYIYICLSLSLLTPTSLLPAGPQHCEVPPEMCFRKGRPFVAALEVNINTFLEELLEMGVRWVFLVGFLQCHKPPMAGNGLYQLSLVIWRMVYFIYGDLEDG